MAAAPRSKKCSGHTAIRTSAQQNLAIALTHPRDPRGCCILEAPDYYFAAFCTRQVHPAMVMGVPPHSVYVLQFALVRDEILVL